MHDGYSVATASMLEGSSDAAVQAARDPSNPTSTRDAEEAIMNRAKAAGAPAFEFDPDASPEQKKAQMKAVRRRSPAQH